MDDSDEGGGGVPLSGCTVDVESPDIDADDDDNIDSSGDSSSGESARLVALKMVGGLEGEIAVVVPTSIFFARFFSFARRFWNQTVTVLVSLQTTISIQV